MHVVYEDDSGSKDFDFARGARRRRSLSNVETFLHYSFFREVAGLGPVLAFRRGVIRLGTGLLVVGCVPIRPSRAAMRLAQSVQ